MKGVQVKSRILAIAEMGAATNDAALIDTSGINNTDISQECHG